MIHTSVPSKNNCRGAVKLTTNRNWIKTVKVISYIPYIGRLPEKKYKSIKVKQMSSMLSSLNEDMFRTEYMNTCKSSHTLSRAYENARSANTVLNFGFRYWAMDADHKPERSKILKPDAQVRLWWVNDSIQCAPGASRTHLETYIGLAQKPKQLA